MPPFQVALETLLLRGPQKPRTHPLASYRYTGEWSVTAGMVWAWLRPPRASQFPRQSHVVSGSHLYFREGLYSLRGTPWALFSSWFLPSVHSFPPGLCLARRRVPGRAGGRHSALESACAWASPLTSGCLSYGICQVGMVVAPTC